MKQIASTHNETYKNLKQLATSAKYRRRNDQTFLEGIHLCQSYLQHVGRPLMYVYTESALENEEVARLIGVCEDLLSPGVLLGEANFKALSSVEHGIGLAFVVGTPKPVAPANLHETALLLEDIQDPGNLGAILRTAAAAGIKQVFSSPGTASAWSPKVLRAGMGAHFAIKIFENSDLSKLVSSSSIPIMATNLKAAENIYQKDLTGAVAWLFGNEGNGVSAGLLSMDVEKVIIPQNPNVESLNVAASVAICLFEQARQQMYTIK